MPCPRQHPSRGASSDPGSLSPTGRRTARWARARPSSIPWRHNEGRGQLTPWPLRATTSRMVIRLAPGTRRSYQQLTGCTPVTYSRPGLAPPVLEDRGERDRHEASSAGCDSGGPLRYRAGRDRGCGHVAAASADRGLRRGAHRREPQRHGLVGSPSTTPECARLSPRKRACRSSTHAQAGPSRDLREHGRRDRRPWRRVAAPPPLLALGEALPVTSCTRSPSSSGAATRYHRGRYVLTARQLPYRRLSPSRVRRRGARAGQRDGARSDAWHVPSLQRHSPHRVRRGQTRPW